MSMNATRFVDYLKRIALYSSRDFNDLSDRLNSKFTALICILGAVMLVMKFNYFDPISCYVPTMTVAAEGLGNYIDLFCLANGIFSVNYSDTIPSTLTDWDIYENKKSVLYMWTPYLLGIQALLFQLPTMLWRCIYNRICKRNMRAVITQACKAVKEEGKDREEKISIISIALQKVLFHNKTEIVRKKCKFNIRSLLKLPVCYLFIKFIFIINIIVQLTIMLAKLDINWSKLFYNENEGYSDSIIGVFPISGHCLLKTNQLVLQNYVVAQCVMTLNMFNEKIYIILLSWMAFVLICTTGSCIQWFKWIYWSSHRNFIMDKLNVVDCKSSKYDDDDCGKESASFDNFLNNYLQIDGIFILQMISSNSDETIFEDVLRQLWTDFSKLKCKLR